MNPLLKKILIIGAPFLLRKLFRGKKIFRKIGLVLLLLIGGIWLFLQYPFNLNQQAPGVASPKEVETAKVEQSDIRSLYRCATFWGYGIHRR